MALIRGLHGLCPCPKCFVPNDKLSEPTNAELRTAAHAHEQLQIANAKPSKTEKEKILKKFSMRPVSACTFLLTFPRKADIL